jgi:hypothetical protein
VAIGGSALTTPERCNRAIASMAVFLREIFLAVGHVASRCDIGSRRHTG